MVNSPPDPRAKNLAEFAKPTGGSLCRRPNWVALAEASRRREAAVQWNSATARDQSCGNEGLLEAPFFFLRLPLNKVSPGHLQGAASHLHPVSQQ